MAENVMKAATMFSGIGAPEVAMPHWNWLWHAEIEKFPNAVMAHHHPQSTNLGDVNGKRFVERAEERGRSDVLVFGSPCQSFSVAGRRLGLDDPRGNLALVALGIVARLKPRWFVFENVPGLLSSDKGRDWGLFLRTVDELGYAGAWASLDAQYFGVAQRRQRLFFVGSSGDWRGPAAVLFEPESVCGHSPPSRAQRERIAPTVEVRANGGGGGWGTDFLAGGGLTEVADIAWALQERDSKGVDSDTKDGHLIIAPMVANGGGQVAVAFDTTQITSKDNRCNPQIGDACHPLASGAHPPAIAFKPSTRSAIRRLTPRECERLQGFPDDYTLVSYRGKPAADGPRYKALGNSMAVPCIRWILMRIEAVDRQQQTVA
jgi:DNA (cytosine-5)-methyltransferase 1